MSLSPDYQDFLSELFEPMGGVRFRKMFGGAGVFHQGLNFAIVADDTLYFKADETTFADFDAEGCGPFVYSTDPYKAMTGYRLAPERLYDEPEDFTVWARKAFAVAMRADLKKPPAKRKFTG